MAAKVGVPKAMSTKICSAELTRRVKPSMSRPAATQGSRGVEPGWATVIDTSKVPPPFRHPGTEILYMFEGVTVCGHGESEYTLRRNDSLLLDGEGLHGPPDLVRLPIKFLAVTAYPIITRTEPASTSKRPRLQGALQCHSPPN